MNRTYPILGKVTGLAVKHRITVFSYRTGKTRVMIWHTGMKSLTFNKTLNKMRRK